MANAQTANVPVPKIGDRTSITQKEGVFEVVDVNLLMQTANVKSTDGSAHVTRNVPWTYLQSLSKK